MTGDPEIGNVDWEKYNHQYLWLMVMTADPHHLMRHAHHLSDFASTTNKKIEEIQSNLQRIFSSWSGDAAKTAADKIGPVLEWAYSSATKASEIAHRLGEYATAINTARVDMPPPTDYGQLNAVHNGGSAEIGDPTMNYFELKAIANNHTATSADAAASKAKAIEVVRVYEQNSRKAYAGTPTFTQPPKIPGIPSIPPSPEPPSRRPLTLTPMPTHDPTPVPPGPGATAQPVDATSLSGYVGPSSGTGALGVPGGSGMLSGLGAVGGVPGAIGSGPGVSSLPGVGLLPNPAVEEGQLDPLAAEQAAAAEGEAGWPGFMPAGAGGRSTRDGEHRDRFSLRPDLIGELPPTYPPVLGL